MDREKVNRFFAHLKIWSYQHRSELVILVSLGLIILLIYFLGWWETLGILFLKFGLGAKVAGAKSFTHAIIKAGGKKAIAAATAGMLTKRHIIDLISRFFAEHSVKRYKRNLKLLLRRKLDEIRHSTPVKKLKAFGSALLSVPMIYFFWTKVLGTAIQKFVYALVLPLLTLLWNLIVTSFNLLGFIFQILMLNLFLETLTRYSWGKKMIAFVDGVIHLIGKTFNLANHLLNYIGINPKAWLVKFSIRFNRWLASILDKGLSRITKVQLHRDRYINAVEALSEKRFIALQSRREKKISYWRTTKKLFVRKVLKKREWREQRAQRAKRWKMEKQTSYSRIHQKRVRKSKREHPLLLPYHKYHKARSLKV